MRDVDESWPEKGSRLHHSVGLWPLLINDHTEVLNLMAGKSISLRARAWPLGEAQVDIRLTAVGRRPGWRCRSFRRPGRAVWFRPRRKACP